MISRPATTGARHHQRVVTSRSTSRFPLTKIDCPATPAAYIADVKKGGKDVAIPAPTARTICFSLPRRLVDFLFHSKPPGLIIIKATAHSALCCERRRMMSLLVVNPDVPQCDFLLLVGDDWPFLFRSSAACGYAPCHPTQHLVEHPLKGRAHTSRGWSRLVMIWWGRFPRRISSVLSSFLSVGLTLWELEGLCICRCWPKAGNWMWCSCRVCRTSPVAFSGSSLCRYAQTWQLPLMVLAILSLYLSFSWSKPCTNRAYRIPRPAATVSLLVMSLMGVKLPYSSRMKLTRRFRRPPRRSAASAKSSYCCDTMRGQWDKKVVSRPAGSQTTPAFLLPMSVKGKIAGMGDSVDGLRGEQPQGGQGRRCRSCLSGAGWGHIGNGQKRPCRVGREDFDILQQRHFIPDGAAHFRDEPIHWSCSEIPAFLVVAHHAKNGGRYDGTFAVCPNLFALWLTNQIVRQVPGQHFCPVGVCLADGVNDGLEQIAAHTLFRVFEVQHQNLIAQLFRKSAGIVEQFGFRIGAEDGFSSKSQKTDAFQEPDILIYRSEWR